MAPVHRIDGAGACPVLGRSRIDPAKTIWMLLMIGGSLAAPFFISVPAVILFFVLSYVTLLFGHSVGLHRMVIHRSFYAVPWLHRSLIALGTLVGMGGPTRIIEIHDLRDWAQRCPDAHDFFTHRRGFLRDISWQLFYKFDLDAAPIVTIEPDIRDDVFVKVMDSGWWAIQIVFAGLLFIIGGVDWVLWGVCLRVFVSVAGHWTVTYICHNPGPGRWSVQGAGVQASDLTGWLAGVLTHGECWHSNHHAFPESARIGLEPGQSDPAWTVINFFQGQNWVDHVRMPRADQQRDDLIERRLAER